jgi:HPt (histidine-containing phosphotransfer) domain-containing protein
MPTTPAFRRTDEPALDPVTVETLFELSDGDDDSFVRDLFTSFLGTYRDCVAGMREAMQTNQSDLMRLKAHTLKGAAANVGALELARVAETLQRLGEEGAFDRAHQELAELQTLYERVEAELARLLPGFQIA